MEKQTTIYLSEKDLKRMDKIKDIYETSKTSDIIKILIREEYERISKYNFNL